MPRWPWQRGRVADPLGSGLWRRLHDDCATAARRAPVLAELLPGVRALAEAGNASWPSDGLDVPADAAGRAHYERLRDIDRAFRDVAYRTRLAEVPGETQRQQHLIDEAAERVRRLLAT